MGGGVLARTGARGSGEGGAGHRWRKQGVAHIARPGKVAGARDRDAAAGGWTPSHRPCEGLQLL